LAFLDLRPDGVYVDCTLGAGGHSSRIIGHLTTGRLIAFDRDAQALDIARRRLGNSSKATLVHRNYAELSSVLDELDIPYVDGILLDAGLSSMQIDSPERGFSFQSDGPLDMRMNPEEGLPAAQFLRTVSVDEITRILREYGDIGPSRRIAKVIAKRRDADALATTSDLAAAVGEALDFVKGTPEETRTVFQAIRMAVNRELESLERALEDGIARLKPGGRFVAISFHSGEDRVIKNVFRAAARRKQELFPDGRVKHLVPPRVRLLTAKPVTPSGDEMRDNPRAHSAKLRVVEKLKDKEKDR